MRLTRDDPTGHCVPAQPCSGWGLPSRPGHPGRWWSLTPPFHPCRRPLAREATAVCSLWHFPSGHPAWELPSTLPCGVRTFLKRKTSVPARGHPANSLFPLMLRLLVRQRASYPKTVTGLGGRRVPAGCVQSEVGVLKRQVGPEALASRLSRVTIGISRASARATYHASDGVTACHSSRTRSAKGRNG